MMKKLILGLAAAGCLFGAFMSCDQDLGYLILDESAGYATDTLAVYVVPSLDQQKRYGLPYYSTAVEGVQGTLPLTYTFYDAWTNDGNLNSLLEYLVIQEGIGKVVIPAEHGIVAGTYWVSVQVTNIYGTEILENAMKIVVVDNS